MSQTENLFKLVQEIEDLKSKNILLKSISSYARFHAFVYYLAAKENIIAEEIFKEINDLQLTTIYLQVCNEEFDNAQWTNSCILLIKKPGHIKDIRTKEEFILFLKCFQ